MQLTTTSHSRFAAQCEPALKLKQCDLLKDLTSRYRIDYGMSSTERLYEYMSARMWGENEGNCGDAYPECPFSFFNIMEANEIEE